MYIGSYRIGQEREGTRPEYYVRDTAAFHESLIACEHISQNAIFVHSPALFSKTFLRSECIQNLAIATKNIQLCDKVKSPLFNSNINQEQCKKHVASPESDNYVSSFEIEHLYQLIGYDVGALVNASGVEYANQYWDSVKEDGPDAEALKLIEGYDLSANIDYGEFLRSRIEMKCNAGVIKSSSVMCAKS